MATASPTPMGPAPIRRTSQRQLRRPLSTVTRSNSHAALSVAASQKNQFHDDTSEDEMPVPMKLSALTKALLNDGTPDDAENQHANGRYPSPPRTRRQASVVNTAAPAAATRRSTRTGAGYAGDERGSSPMREHSPARKRVVRLSNTPQSLSQMQGSFRRSTSSSQSAQRPPSHHDNSDRVNEHNDSHVDVKTPAQSARVVRIASGTRSSANRSRLDSGNSSNRSNYDRSMMDRSAVEHEQEQIEAPDTAARNSAYVGTGSVSRYPSTRTRPEEINPQGSMRVKRVGKLSGSFLSGPARRGRRRQSEDDEEGNGEQDVAIADAPAQQVEEQPAPFHVDLNRDFNSGSPLSASRTSNRRHPAAIDVRVDSARPSPRQEEPPKEPESSNIGDIGHLVSVGRLQMPSALDKENDMPLRTKWSKPVIDDLDKARRPLHAEVRVASPERKPLAAITRNTPHRQEPPPPPKMSVLEAATANSGAATVAQTKQRRNILRVNGKCYTRLDCLGRGGSGKVYRVTAENGAMFALKRVSLENADEATIKGYKGEIDLLEKLTDVSRVVNLVAHEMNSEKQMLSLVMEMGERDLNGVMNARQSPDSAKLDMVFVRFTWKEMLECVQAVHRKDIVHSDLKPANFVLVKGELKLIDFGIANAIQTDQTVNVHRETQIGTPNYMSPESLLDSNNPRGGRMPGRPKLMKLGKPSDVWSLGCILYQMVYGVPPFGHIANQMARCQAIINWDHHIEFPSRGMGGVPVPPSLIRTMRRCLNRDVHMRPTCDELLEETDPFLYPAEFSERALPIDEELLGRIIHSVVSRCRERMPTDSESSSVWPQAYWASIRKAMVGKM